MGRFEDEAPSQALGEARQDLSSECITYVIIHQRAAQPYCPSTTSTHTVKMSNRNPMEDYLNRIRGQIQKSAAGGGGGMPRMPGTPRIAAGVAGAVLLTGGFWLVQNGLFNVDGGHRAIKYRRTTGVSKEIFGEGASYI